MELSLALEQPNASGRPRFSRQRGELIGSECRSCGQRSWPGRSVCQRCRSADVTPASLATQGRVLTYSTVWVPRPGLEAPYVLGQVLLDDGVRLFAHLRQRGEPATDPSVHMVFAQDERTVPPFWFEPR
jgi:uncharacterized OB-fold protein